MIILTEKLKTFLECFSNVPDSLVLLVRGEEGLLAQVLLADGQNGRLYAEAPGYVGGPGGMSSAVGRVGRILSVLDGAPEELSADQLGMSIFNESDVSEAVMGDMTEKPECSGKFLYSPKNGAVGFAIQSSSRLSYVVIPKDVGNMKQVGDLSEEVFGTASPLQKIEEDTYMSLDAIAELEMRGCPADELYVKTLLEHANETVTVPFERDHKPEQEIVVEQVVNDVEIVDKPGPLHFAGPVVDAPVVSVEEYQDDIPGTAPDTGDPLGNVVEPCGAEDVESPHSEAPAKEVSMPEMLPVENRPDVIVPSLGSMDDPAELDPFSQLLREAETVADSVGKMVTKVMGRKLEELILKAKDLIEKPEDTGKQELVAVLEGLVASLRGEK